jgi:hypothetical protein
MRIRRAIALAGVAAAATFAACKEPPFAPRWDADMFLPLSTKSIYLNNFFAFGFIPPNTSGNVSFPPQQQDVSGTIGNVLKNLVTDPTRARTVLTLTVAKHTAISADDTLVVAPDSASLTNASPSRILFPLALATTDTLRTDSVSLGTPQICMLQNQAGTHACPLASGPSSASPLWIQLRGRVSNPAASPLTITSADSLSIKLTVTARVALVHN